MASKQADSFRSYPTTVGCLVLIICACLFGLYRCQGPDSPRWRKAVARELQEAKSNVLKNVDAQDGMMRLRGAAKSSNSFERTYAVGTIGELGPKGADAMPELLEALQTEDLYVRREAAIAAGKMGAAGCQAVPSLIRLLHFRESDSSIFAAESLGKLGSCALEAVPALRVAAQDSNPDLLKSAARKALNRLTGVEDE